MDLNVSSPLADFSSKIRYSDLPEQAIRNAKLSLLDTLGVMLAASSMPEPQPFIRMAGANRHGACSIAGHGFKADLMSAVFANGAMVHVLDFEDAHDAALVHPTASSIPVALSMAEAEPALTGRDLIVAVTLGCEVVTRLSLAFEQPPEKAGWFRPSLLGVFGGAAAAGRLRGLAPDRMLDAFALGLCRLFAPGEIVNSRRSTLRAVRDAWACRAGVESVELAQLGLQAFDRPFEGDSGLYALYGGGGFDSAALVGGLGERFHIEDLGYKPWPSCRATHPAIEAVIAMASDHDLRPDSVRRILVEAHPFAKTLMEPREQRRAPTTAIDAKFSLPYTCARALKDREVGLTAFDESVLQEEDVRELAGRVELRTSGDFHPTQARVTIENCDGARFSETIRDAAGSSTRPLSEDQLVAKFRECAGRALRPLPAEKVDHLIETILSCERVEKIGAQLWE